MVSMVCGALAFTVSAFAQGGAGTISGTVKLEGAAPTPKKIEITRDREVCGLKPHFEQDLVVGSGGGIQYAVVSLTGIKAAPKPQEVTFDQKGCQYNPHVLAFPAGSTVKILNSDGILHTIHSYATKNPSFNIAQPGFNKVITVTEAQPQLIKVTCDEHGWMNGWWYVTSNPYFAVTDERGNFTIKEVPPGDYTIQVWQEKLAPAGKELTQKVSVKAGATATANFTLK